jgi:hypothetical protein
MNEANYPGLKLAIISPTAFSEAFGSTITGDLAFLGIAVLLLVF